MTALPLQTLSIQSLPIPGNDRWYAAGSDPALSVMTDFRERASITISAEAAIDTALEHMKHTGVRCAFAIDDAAQTVIGMITAYDIISEKPMRLMQSADTPRREIRVRDLMLPIREWRVADVRDLERAKVADLVRLFDETGLTHIAVMESTLGNESRLRGLLSAAKIRRLLAH